MKVIAILLFVIFNAITKAYPTSKNCMNKHKTYDGIKLPEAVKANHPEWFNEEIINKSRIIGGSESALGAIPWIASVREYGNTHICGASIISKRTLVSAVHCFLDTTPSLYQIRYNSLNHGSGGTIVQVLKIIPFHAYNNSNYVSDIALIHLSAEMILGQTQARSLLLPASGSYPKTGLSTITAGWGHTTHGGSDSAVLRHVSVPIISPETCRSILGTSFHTGMICAGILSGGADACQNDSGGPLMFVLESMPNSAGLIGVVSWGVGCGLPNLPGVYTNVGYYVDWIISNRL